MNDRVILGVILAAALAGTALAQSSTDAIPATDGAADLRPTDLTTPLRGETLMRAAYADIPQRARDGHQTGRVDLDCLVARNGYVSCTIVSETPEGWEFGAAALRLARYFRAAARAADGRSTEGAHVRLGIIFAPDAAQHS